MLYNLVGYQIPLSQSQKVINAYNELLSLGVNVQNLYRVNDLKSLQEILKSSDFYTVILAGESLTSELSGVIKESENASILTVGKNYHLHLNELLNKFRNSKNFVYKLYTANAKELSDFFKKYQVPFSLSLISKDIRAEFCLDGLSNSEKDRFFKEFLDEFCEYIYAERDISLKEQLVSILKIRSIKLAVAESFTGGLLQSAITSISGASSVFYEGLTTYSEDAKHKRLGVLEKTLENYKPVSGDVAYEMCTGLLNGGADLVISTTGIAGPNSDNSNFPVGLIYIGVGSQKKISVYKYQLSGSRADICNEGVNLALFNAIMALRKGDYDL